MDDTLHITHTAGEGTLISGTARGDGTAEILKAQGWRWSRGLGSWYVPQSRDREAKTWIVDSAVQELRAGGFLVDVVIDDTARSTEQVEAGRIERQGHRVEVLDARADRLAVEAVVADQTLDALPTYPLGQPILVGHHSEGRMRRDLERRDRAMRVAVDASAAADQAAAEASAAAGTTGHRYDPRTVGGRIEVIEADIRRLERERDGYSSTVYIAAGGARMVETFSAAAGARRERIGQRIGELTGQRTYWAGVLGRAVDAGAVVVYDWTTVAAGDEVLVGGRWYTVVRANRKTVTVPTGHSWTGTVPYREIRDHRAMAPAAGESLVDDKGRKGRH